MAQLEQLSSQLDRLAAFDASPFPVVSLYLNLQPNQYGKDQFQTFLRKELDDRVRTFPASGPERESLEKDSEKIKAYVEQIDSSANGLALFSCTAGDLFEAMPLAAPIPEHRLYVSDQPHLYPLARVLDEYPRYAVLLADTTSSRIFVFAVNAVQQREQLEGTKTRRHKMGGWSQARFQRHIDNFHLKHAKEVVDTLARIVREEMIQSIIVAGDDVAVPLVKDQMPKDIAERVVDILKLDMHAADREVLEATIAKLREKDAETDREHVDALIGAYRANGLACVGYEATRKAFELGQVDELVIAAKPEAIKPGKNKKAGQTNDQDHADRTPEERAADELIIQARNTSAKIRFIEDTSLLDPIGGVGAFLRFKV